MEDKIFKFSVIISLILHTFAFASLLFANLNHKEMIVPTVEVVYYQQPKVKAQPVPKKSPKGLQEKKWTPEPDILSKKSSMNGTVMKEISKQPVKLFEHEKQTSRTKSLSGKKNITVPLLKSEKITNPKYLNYHDRIRNKIRDRAYFYVDDPEFQTGKVYLTFVIASTGELKATKIIEGKTNANDYLRNVGLRSIKESSPFPSFPADLQYPELSFNVVISFEVSE